MAIATLASHVFVARDYLNKINSMYAGIAQGPLNGWPNDLEPPEENITTTQLQNLLGVKHVSTGHLVVPIIPNNKETGGKPLPSIDANVIKYKGQQWEPILNPNDYMKYGARWLLVECDINPEDINYGIFRQDGIYMGLQPLPSVSNKPALMPSQIQNTGTLMTYNNDRIQGYYSNTNLHLKYVMEF